MYSETGYSVNRVLSNHSYQIEIGVDQSEVSERIKDDRKARRKITKQLALL